MTDLKNDAQRVYDKNFPNSNFKSKGLKADKAGGTRSDHFTHGQENPL